MKLRVSIWKDHRGYYRAACRALPGCISVGMTRQEALDRIHATIRSYMASMHAQSPLEVEHECVGASWD